MSAFELLTFNPQKGYPVDTFYVLNRGLNSGKPLTNPCPNCFACICKNAEERCFYYWLFMLIWRGGFGKSILVGSVIPFVRKRELISLANSIINGLESRERLDEVFRKLEAIEEFEKKQKILLLKVQDLKIGLLRGVVK